MSEEPQTANIHYRVKPILLIAASEFIWAFAWEVRKKGLMLTSDRDSKGLIAGKRKEGESETVSMNNRSISHSSSIARIAVKPIFFFPILLFWACTAFAECPLHSEKNWGVANNSSYVNYGYHDPLPSFANVIQGYGIGSTNYPEHIGVDWYVSAGTDPVFAICKGVITTDSQDFTYQKTVRGRNNYDSYFNSRIIISCDRPNGGSFLAIYGHVDGQTKAIGQTVDKGEKIGIIAPAYDLSNQRRAKNDHLHLGIRYGYSTPFWSGNGGFGIAPYSVTLASAEANGYFDPLNTTPTHKPFNISTD